MMIRPLSPAELPLRLGLLDFNDPEDMIRSNTARMESGSIDIFGLFDGPALVGELSVKYESEDPTEAIPGQRAYLYAFRVHSSRQGQGLGTMLLNHVIANLAAQGYRELTVGVENDNPRAIHMYQKAGFLEVLAHKQEEYQGDAYEYDLLLRTIQ